MIQIKKSLIIFLFFALYSGSSSFAQEMPDPKVLLEKMDAVLRSQSHEMTVTLDVKTPRWERHYQFRVWMEGVDHTFSRVLEPAKVEGQGFLRIKSRLWNYLPTAERTILIPPSMMLDKFMGSDFTNDDFVKLSYLPRDYEGKIIGEEIFSGYDAYQLELTPFPDAPVSYEKLELWVRKQDGAPLRIKFYNEKLVHIRTLDYLEYKMFGNHESPSVLHMQNIKEPGRETTMTILEAVFDEDIEDFIFTRENLERV